MGLRPSAMLSVLALGALACADVSREQPLILACDSAFDSTIGAEPLAQRYGAGNVSTEAVSLGEGFVSTGTVLFPTDSTRRVEIAWKDTAGQHMPLFVRIRGDSSAWETPQGLTLGLSLLDVERLNGRPFQLFGFAFDGSGFVSSWSGGTLDGASSATCSMRARLDPTVEGPEAEQWFQQLQGEKEFSSDHPGMLALNPRVVEVLLRYP
jgi:hypothetical protein